MDRKEFLAQLKNELREYDQSQVNELVSDYESHFSEGISEHRLEKEIAEKLGDPKLIAREYKTALLVKKAEDHTTTTNVLRALLAFVGLGFFNLVFVFGPFIGAIAILFSLLMTGVAVVVSGFAGMVAAFIWPYVPQIDIIANPVATFFYSLAMACFGALFTIAFYEVSKWFLKITLQYIKFNLSIISGGK
jgi:uncharacterized membrane protein